jgi:hypothetical protein
MYEISYDKATYQSSLAVLPTTLTNFTKMFTTMTNWLREQRKVYMGPDQDIFLKRYFAIYDLSLQDSNTCGSVVVIYPGQPIYFNTTNVDGSGCLNLALQYGDLWTKTLAKKPNQFFLTQL